MKYSNDNLILDNLSFLALQLRSGSGWDAEAAFLILACGWMQNKTEWL